MYGYGLKQDQGGQLMTKGTLEKGDLRRQFDLVNLHAKPNETFHEKSRRAKKKRAKARRFSDPQSKELEDSATETVMCCFESVKTGKRLQETMRADICAAYQTRKNKSVADIAREWEISRKRVNNILDEEGIPKRRRSPGHKK